MNRASSSPTQCPQHAFPLKLHILILYLCSRYQVSYEMAAAVLLSVMAEAAQGYADVSIPGFTRSPLSLWILLLAESGEGKSPIRDLLRRAIVALERELAEKHEERMDDYRINLLAWTAIRQETLANIKRAVRNGDPIAHLQEELVAHNKQKPQKPRLVKINYPNATPQALRCCCANKRTHFS